MSINRNHMSACVCVCVRGVFHVCRANPSGVGAIPCRSRKPVCQCVVGHVQEPLPFWCGLKWAFYAIRKSNPCKPWDIQTCWMMQPSANFECCNATGGQGRLIQLCPTKLSVRSQLGQLDKAAIRSRCNLRRTAYFQIISAELAAEYSDNNSHERRFCDGV